jgi:hypothetical protein
MPSELLAEDSSTMLSIETPSVSTEASSVLVCDEQAPNKTAADRLNKLINIFLYLISIHPFLMVVLDTYLQCTESDWAFQRIALSEKPPQ